MIRFINYLKYFANSIVTFPYLDFFRQLPTLYAKSLLRGTVLYFRQIIITFYLWNAFQVLAEHKNAESLGLILTIQGLFIVEFIVGLFALVYAPLREFIFDKQKRT